MPTGLNPRGSLRSGGGALASFSSSGSAKKAAEAARVAATSASGTPWPATVKKPVSRHAASTAAATARFSSTPPSRQGAMSMSGTLSSPMTKPLPAIIVTPFRPGRRVRHDAPGRTGSEAGDG